MRQFLLLILFFAQIAFAKENGPLDGDNPNTLANYDGLPATVVNGCVNVITGDYIESSEDLTLPFPDPVTISRFYTSSDASGDSFVKGSLLCGWNLNHMGSVAAHEFDDFPEENYCSIRTSGGGNMKFNKKSKKTKKQYAIAKELFNYGLTNTGRGVIGGAANIRNSTLTKVDSKEYHLVDGAGDRKIYRKHKKKNYLLEKETLPNGNTMHYSYKDMGHSGRKKPIPLERISVKNFAGQEIAFINFDLSKISEKKPRICAYGSDGRCIEYDFTCIRDRPVLASAARSSGPKETYEYEKVPHGFGSFSRLCQKKTEGGFVRSVEYQEAKVKKGNPGNFSYPGCKVKKLIDPCDRTFTFEYLRNKRGLDTYGQTRVTDPLGHLTLYKYDSSLRPISIERGFRFEKFRWGNSDHDKGNLLQRLVEDNEKIHLAHRYHYDDRGNVVTKQLIGNLTGRCEIRFGTNQHGFVIPSDDNCYEERSIYSDDGRNLVLVHDNGRCLKKYSYEPKRSLCTAEFTFDRGTLKERRFYSYDATGAKTEEIIDDGISEKRTDLSGVTHRLITRYINYEEMPFFGLHKEEAKYAYNSLSGDEVLLSRYVYHYRPSDGCLISQSVYDANNVFLYEFKWEYDSHGNVISEIDALGYVTQFEYDKADRLTKVASAESIKTYSYNPLGNLISESQYDLKTGRTETIRHAYNPLKQRIKTTDPYGNETRFQYDIYGNLAATNHPDYFTLSGERIERQERFHNDIMGNTLEKIDALGNKTSTKYTARMQPYHIRYPDGSIEKKVYAKDGLLETHYNRNGSVVSYEYDYKGRVTRKIVKNRSGAILSNESYRYDTFNLIEEVDANGYATTYIYDMAGRLISTKKGDAETTFTYNSQGLVETKHILTTNTDAIITNYMYDLKGRLVTETTSNIETVYTYDAEDKVLTKTTGSSTATTEYDSWGRVLSVEDALGNKTFSRYEAAHQALKIITVDPKGIVTTTLHNPDSSIRSVSKHNLFGTILAEEAYEYDTVGNRTLIKTSVIEQREGIRTIETRFTYDWEGNVTSIIEAYGEPEQKITRHTYNDRGQKECTLKSDGITLFYAYDDLGLLSRLHSSDGTVDYFYTYDAKRNPTTCNHTKREYDAHDRMISETFENGLTLNFTYDRAGQLQTIEYPDMSASKYVYSGSLLKKITRLDAQGNERYCHKYKAYDNQGNPTTSVLPGSASQSSTSYDALSRVISIEALNWHCRDIEYDSVGNLITYTTDQFDAKYSYDDLNQLASEEGVCSNHFINDSISNITHRNDSKRPVNALNQLLSENKAQYQYDPNGNLISINGLRLSYDALDRLIEIKTPSETIAYSYDAWNRRTSKSTGEQYLYIGQNEIGMYNDGIKELRLLGLGKGAEIGSSVSIELSNNVYIPIHDLSGSIVLLLDMQGDPIAQQHYNAYGEALLDDWIAPWGFASKRLDAETGFLNFGRRYYRPSMCKWITPDPIGYDDGSNLYAYVKNNPLTYFDEYGLFSLLSSLSFSSSSNYGQNWSDDTINQLSRPDRNQNVISNNSSFGASPLGNPFNQCCRGLNRINQFESAFLATLDAISMKNPAFKDCSIGAIDVSPKALGVYAPKVFSKISSVTQFSEKAFKAKHMMDSSQFMRSTSSKIKDNLFLKYTNNNQMWVVSKKSVGQIWTQTKNRTSAQNAYKHWKVHGHEFPDIQNAKQYVEKAHIFFRDPNALYRVRADGSFLRYNPHTNVFGSYSNAGVPKTMFKPGVSKQLPSNYSTPIEYFYGQ